MEESFEGKVAALYGTDLCLPVIALSLSEAGFDVRVLPDVCEGTEVPVELFEGFGASVCDTLADALDGADVVITMLSCTSDIEEAYLGGGGILDLLREGTYALDLSTSTPALARDIFGAGALKGVHVLDAPIDPSRSDPRRGCMLLAGGARADFDALLPLLSLFAQASYFGPAGAGQAAKLARTSVLAGQAVSLAEAASLAASGGADLLACAEVLLEDALPADDVLARLADPGAAEPGAPGFYPAIEFLSDLSVALEAADEAELTLPGVETAHQLFGLLCAVGGDALPIEAVAVLYGDDEAARAAGIDWSLLDEDDCDDEECGCHHHHHGPADDDGFDFGGDVGDQDDYLGGFFSKN